MKQWMRSALASLAALVATMVASPPAQAAVHIPDCGGENQRVCKWTDQEYYDTGLGSCEYDLKESNGVCVNDKRRIWAGRNAWLEWALKQQRYGISVNEPINWVPHVSGHNAFSSRNQGFGIDQSNQTYSISDQLRMGVRFLEIDPHYSEGQYVVCHNGKQVCLPSYRRRLAYVFDEIRNWLRDNPDEVLFIKLDEHVGDNTAGLGELINHYFGNTVYKRAADPKQWPTVAQVRAAGKQVLLATRNAQISSTTYMWYFDFNYATGRDHPSDFTLSACTDGDGRATYSRPKWMWSALAEGRSASNFFDPTGLIPSGEAVAAYLRCGVSVVGLDYLDALGDSAITLFRSYDKDERIAGSVWTFEPSDYGRAGPVMLRGNTGRWASRPPAEPRRFACALVDAGADFQSRGFRVTQAADVWTRGEETCRREFGSGYRFAVPTLPHINNAVMRAAGGSDVWLNYSLVAQRDPIALPGTLQFITPVGLKPTEPRDITVYGRTDQPRSLVAKADVEWLQLSWTDGTAVREAGNRLRVSMAPQAPVDPGEYKGTVSVGYQDGSGTVSQIPVLYRIQPELLIGINPARAVVRQPEEARLTVQLLARVPKMPISGGAVTLREVLTPPTDTQPATYRDLGTRNVQGSGVDLKLEFVVPSRSLSQGVHQLVAEYSGGPTYLASRTGLTPLEVLPRIEVQPASVSFTLPPGGPLPAPQALKIAGAQAAVKLGKLPAWAQAQQVGNEWRVGLNAAALQLPAGRYAASFLVSDGQPGENTVPLTLDVQPSASGLPVLYASSGGPRRSGAGDERYVPLRIVNNGPGAAVGVQINSIGVEVLGGSGNVTVRGGLPIALPSLAAGGSATPELLLRWPATATRVRLTLSLTANDGSYTTTTAVSLIR